MEKSEEGKRESRSLRMLPEIWVAAKQLAKAENRSLGNYFETLVKREKKKLTNN